MFKNISLVFLILLLTLLSASGCSRVSVKKELANKGVHRLDEKNPYVFTNQYLSESIKDSPITRGFIRSEGTPDALAVKKSFWGNYKTHLYYLPERKAFLIEEKSGGPIIKGPARIPDGIYQDLKRIPPLTKPAALVLKPGGPVVKTKTEHFQRPTNNQYQSRRQPAPRGQTSSYSAPRASLATQKYVLPAQRPRRRISFSSE